MPSNDSTLPCTNASRGLTWRIAGRLATNAPAVRLATAWAAARPGVVGAPRKLSATGAPPALLTVTMSSDVAAVFPASGLATQPAKRAAVDRALKTDPSFLFITAFRRREPAESDKNVGGGSGITSQGCDSRIVTPQRA